MRNLRQAQNKNLIVGLGWKIPLPGPLAVGVLYKFLQRYSLVSLFSRDLVIKVVRCRSVGKCGSEKKDEVGKCRSGIFTHSRMLNMIEFKTFVKERGFMRK